MKHYATDTTGKTENFFTRNVKLITFLICIAVFLGIFGPLSVFHIYQYYVEMQEDAAYVDMTVEDLRALAKRAETLTEKDFERYSREDGGDWTVGPKTGRMFYIQIGERYQLSCMIEVQSRQVVYLSLLDDGRGESFDLLDDSVDIDEILKS
ncbi:MAG: hypothetical protein IJX80_09290 [Clostridia bacterium]|nr:hypothetical protein [Clostridia bacterium]